MSEFHPPCEAWFGREAVAATTLHGGGLSGSPVVLVRRPSGERLVLKRFAPHVPPERAAWVHALMGHLATAGLDTVPRLRPRLADARWAPPIRHCESLVADDAGRLWEAADFLSGSPRTRPSAAEAAAALAGLARLHAAAARLSGPEPRIEPSPGVRRRVMQAAEIQAAPWRRLEPDARRFGPPAVTPLVLQAIEIFASSRGATALGRVSAVGEIAVVAQPVLRDVWSDHVLFLDDGRLTGFIDFHAAGRDTPATDLARLLGSWDATANASRGPWLEHWRQALDAYEAERPLAPGERGLVPWLHATGVICGLDNWFRWLITERREFADISRVRSRIARLVNALPEALDIAGSTAPGRD
jgi:Ser/Thr protein kinase RdoA (MazF antagonist)